MTQLISRISISISSFPPDTRFFFTRTFAGGIVATTGRMGEYWEYFPAGKYVGEYGEGWREYPSTRWDPQILLQEYKYHETSRQAAEAMVRESEILAVSEGL